MRRFRDLVQGAGLGHLPFWQVSAAGLFLPILIALVVQRSSQLVGLSLASAVLTGFALLEALRLATARRTAVLRDSLPQVIEALQSGVAAGMPVSESFGDLSVVGPPAMRKIFATAVKQLESGVPFEPVLEWIKRDVAHYQCDQLIELLKLSETSGGVALASNLGRLAATLRSESATMGEIAAKQGWVVGTAKLALATPWVVIALLGQRPENANFYNSQSGIAVLFTGLALCLTAFVAIQRFARLPIPERVFAQ